MEEKFQKIITMIYSYKLYASLRIIYGSSNLMLIDLDRKIYYHLSNIYKEFFLQLENGSLVYNEEIKNHELADLLDYLLELDLIHIVSSVNLFPPISTEWDMPFNITNIIIDDQIESSEAIKTASLISEIGGIKTIMFRYFNKISLRNINEIVKCYELSDCETIQILVEFSKDILTSTYFHELTKNPYIELVIIFNCPDDLSSLSIKNFGFCNVVFEKDKIEGAHFCGLVDKDYFTLNMKFYTESLHHNSCLNRKISIDSEGNIKNCPSMSESYGNIKDTTLAEAIEKPGFKKYWNINKDQISVCKDCEFRYICTDCRAYVEDPHDTSGPEGINLSKPLKCGYNPYTGEWSEWSTNPLKQKAIEYYGMREMNDEF